MKTTVMVVDGSALVRRAFCALIDEQPDMRSVGQTAATDRSRLASALRRQKPETVILVMGVHDITAMGERVAAVRKCRPAARVVVVLPFASKRCVEQAEAAGAAVCVYERGSVEDLVTAIRGAEQGRKVLAHRPPVAVRAAGRANRCRISTLTPRQRDVLRLLADGNNTKEIADILGISAKTVETHRLHIMNRLRCHSVAGLTKLAIREGLTSLLR